MSTEFIVPSSSNPVFGVYHYERQKDLDNLLFDTDHWVEITIDGNRIIDKHSFLEIASRALQYPASFGKNWDAFADFLTDLSWLPAEKNIVIFLENMEKMYSHSRTEINTVVDIFQDAAKFWEDKNRLFLVLADVPAIMGLRPFDVTRMGS